MSNSVGIRTTSGNRVSGFTAGSLGSLSKFIAGIGYPYNGPGPRLGEGLPGLMPQPLPGHDSSDAFARTRFMLRNSWNTKSVCGSSNPKRIVTPFRAVYNAGDLLCRENYACGGDNCQSVQSRPNMKGLRHRLGGNSQACVPSVIWSLSQMDPSVPASTCNPKFVYDSSDYIRFKKDQATNRNYNDRFFGGNESNASQTAIRHVRRY